MRAGQPRTCPRRLAGACVRGPADRRATAGTAAGLTNQTRPAPYDRPGLYRREPRLALVIPVPSGRECRREPRLALVIPVPSGSVTRRVAGPAPAQPVAGRRIREHLVGHRTELVRHHLVDEPRRPPPRPLARPRRAARLLHVRRIADRHPRVGHQGPLARHRAVGLQQVRDPPMPTRVSFDMIRYSSVPSHGFAQRVGVNAVCMSLCRPYTTDTPTAPRGPRHCPRVGALPAPRA